MSAPSLHQRSAVETILRMPRAQVAVGTKTLAERKSWIRPAVLIRASSALVLGIGVGAWIIFPDQIRDRLQGFQSQVSKAWLSHPAFVEGRAMPGPNPALPVDFLDQWKEALAQVWRTSPARQCIPEEQQLVGDPTIRIRDKEGCPLIAPEVSAIRPLRPF